MGTKQTFSSREPLHFDDDPKSFELAVAVSFGEEIDWYGELA